MKVATLVLLLSVATFAQSNQPRLAVRSNTTNASDRGIVREVRHELLMLPYYSIFDDLEFQVSGDTVTLLGAVTNPTLKSDAENAVKHVEGVSKVNNQIKVLPPSPMDDRIRRAEAQAIFSKGDLYRYSTSAAPPIHIIVDNGHVTLTGVVDNQGDKNLAGIAANGVPGVFSVTNDLRVAKS